MGIISLYSMNIFYFIVCWTFFPTEWRQSRDFRKRYGYFVILQLVTIVASTIYNIVVVNGLKISSDRYQPMVALILPLTRELTIWICSKLIKKTSNGDECGAIIVIKYRLTAAYTVILCNILGSIVTEQTSWILIGIDYLFNVEMCLRIIWLKKKRPNMIQRQLDAIQNLALAELVEFQAPLAFLLVLGVTYIGPNGHLFGNILNSYWTYTAIENIDQYLMNNVVLLLVDLSSTSVTCIALWFFCKLNMWKVFLNLQKEFGHIFFILLARFYTVVSKDLNSNFNFIK